jgi:hypothetical protein
MQTVLHTNECEVAVMLRGREYSGLVVPQQKPTFLGQKVVKCRVMNPIANNKNSKKDYSNLSKEDLIKIVEKLESRKKYGLIWDEDGTDVEEFDNALNNRLIHFSHTLGAEEWIDNFAKERVHSTVVSYIRAYPEKLYQNPTENTKAYATPRSWTFLSDFICKNFGKDASPKVFLPVLRNIAHSFIGNGAQRFLQYCEEMINITIQDIIDRYDAVVKELDKYNRDKNSELIQSLKEYDIKKFTEKQLDNVTKFLKRVGDDELTAYLLHVLDNVPDVSDPKIKKFMISFKDVLVNIKRINKPTK